MDVGRLNNDAPGVAMLLEEIDLAVQDVDQARARTNEKQQELNTEQVQLREAQDRAAQAYDALYDWLMAQPYRLAPMQGSKLGKLLSREAAHLRGTADDEDDDY